MLHTLFYPSAIAHFRFPRPAMMSTPTAKRELSFTNAVRELDPVTASILKRKRVAKLPETTAIVLLLPGNSRMTGCAVRDLCWH